MSTSRGTNSLARTAVIVLAGAAPILAIPASILGLAPLSWSSAFVVVPLALAALVLMLTEFDEARLARAGMLAGLAAVTAYDCLRMPLVAAGMWPDFIPQLGGRVLGTDDDNPFVGYLWRYLGDGGGMGVVFFAAIGIVLALRPRWIIGQAVAVGVGYGVFVWTGLLATLMLPGGQESLFRISLLSFVLSLLGHLVYGSVLGIFLRFNVDAMLGAQPTRYVAARSGDVAEGRDRRTERTRSLHMWTRLWQRSGR